MTLDEMKRAIDSALAENRGIRLTLPAGGRLFFDRPLPFICLYRRPRPIRDDVGEQLVSSQSAYLVMEKGRAQRQICRSLLAFLSEKLVERFGSFLVLEVWESPPEPEAEEAAAPPEGPVSPRFDVVIQQNRHHPAMLSVLTTSLARIRIARQAAIVRVRTDVDAAHHRPLETAGRWKQRGAYYLGLEVLPIYREPSTSIVYPRVLTRLRRALGRAVQQAIFAFVREATTIRPEHYHRLGRRRFVKAVWEVDRQLAEIDRSFDLLLQATPVNAEACWSEFRRARFQRTPVFHYRPLPIAPLDIKRKLLAIPIERIEDASIAHLLGEKQRELDRRISMLADIGTSRFLGGSLQVFGGVDRAQLHLAARLLDKIPRGRRAKAERKAIDASAFAERAAAEIERYREKDPGFLVHVEVREDMYSGLLVSGSRLFIGRKTTVPRKRADALLQHEIGTHLLTFYNGSAQRFQQLATGLAGYDRFQEGLALVAEYFAGGLTAQRVRLIAGRVIAVDSLLCGATFIETFRRLHDEFGFKPRIAFVITMRVYRAGGLTKDAMYLQGLVDVLEYVQDGGDIETLFVGKIAARHVPLMEELRIRGLLTPPRLAPRFLSFPSFAERLTRLREGVDVAELTEENV